MTESKGPETQDRTAGPGKKKRKSLLDRLRPYAVGLIAMAVVFGGSALIGEHVRATKDDKVKEPSGVVGAPAVPTGPQDTASPGAGPASGAKLAIPVKPSVPVTITIYEDLRSPDSRAFAEEYQPTLDELLTTGQVELHYQLVTASDRQYGGSGARIAANGAACAQDQGRFTQFVQQVWKHQPQDPHNDLLSHKREMQKFARNSGKIQMSKFDPCMEQADHNGWVLRSQAAFAAADLGAVPAVQINATTVKTVHTTLTPKKLRALVLKEAKRVVKLQAGPTATPALAN